MVGGVLQASQASPQLSSDGFLCVENPFRKVSKTGFSTENLSTRCFSFLPCFFLSKKQASLPQLSSGKLNLVEKRGQFGKVPKSYSYRCVSRVRLAEESPSIEFYHFAIQNVQNVDTRINFKRGSSEFSVDVFL